MREALAATVIGGYLGAGKTTMVNHLLRHANGQRLAVLVNEFGALPIDADLIEAESDDLISIAGGCICCSFGSDLTAALIDMAARDPRPDHVVIESSGVAMPGAIAASIGLLQDYFVAGVVVLADCETVRAHAADEYLGDTTLRQLQDADLIVQSKVDLVAASVRGEVETWLRQINDRAAIVPARDGAVPNAVVLGQRDVAASAQPGTHADAAFDSRVYRLDGARDPQRLAQRLAGGDLGVVRSKGFVRDGHGQLWSVQTVGKRWRCVEFARPARPELVCIGLRGGLDSGAVDRVLEADSEKVVR